MSTSRKKAPPLRKPPTVARELLEIREALELARNHAHVAGAAVTAENHHLDSIAIVIQRSVADAIGRALERLEAVTQRCKAVRHD